MGLGSMLCNNVINVIRENIHGIKCVYAYEPEKKDIPLSETVAALSIKRNVISEELYGEDEDGVRHPLGMRKMTLTLGANFYTPCERGTSAGVNAYDAFVDIITERFWNDLKEIRLLGTSYSRETQSLITRAEFDFNFFAMAPMQQPTQFSEN